MNDDIRFQVLVHAADVAQVRQIVLGKVGDVDAATAVAAQFTDQMPPQKSIAACHGDSFVSKQGKSP